MKCIKHGACQRPAFCGLQIYLFVFISFKFPPIYHATENRHDKRVYFCGTSAFLGYRHKAAVWQMTDFVSRQAVFCQTRIPLKPRVPQNGSFCRRSRKRPSENVQTASSLLIYRCQPASARTPKASPMRTGDPAASLPLRRMLFFGNRLITVEPRRKAPISCPFSSRTAPSPSAG